MTRRGSEEREFAQRQLELRKRVDSWTDVEDYQVSNIQPWINGEEIDREVAEKELCPQCGSPMKFRSERVPARVDNFGMRTPASYRAFAVCTNEECGEEIEF